MNLPLHKEAGRYVVADSFGDIAFNAYSLYDLDLCTFWLNMVGYPFKLLLVFMEINVPSCPIPFKQCSNESTSPHWKSPRRSRGLRNLQEVGRLTQSSTTCPTNCLPLWGVEVKWPTCILFQEAQRFGVFFSEMDSQKGFVRFVFRNQLSPNYLCCWWFSSLGEIWWNLVAQWPSLVVKESRNRLIKRS